MVMARVLKLAISCSDERFYASQDSSIFFTQQDVDEGKLFYVNYGLTANESSVEFSSDKMLVLTRDDASQDEFKFDVTNGITALRDLAYKIQLVSCEFRLFAGSINVSRDGTATLHEKDFKLEQTCSENGTDYAIDKLLLVEKPSAGYLVRTDLNEAVFGFSRSDLERGIIAYKNTHDSDDLVRLVARVSGVNTTEAVIRVNFIKSETPPVVSNIPFEVFESSTAVVTRGLSTATDVDSRTSEITFRATSTTPFPFFNQETPEDSTRFTTQTSDVVNFSKTGLHGYIIITWYHLIVAGVLLLLTLATIALLVLVKVSAFKKNTPKSMQESPTRLYADAAGMARH